MTDGRKFLNRATRDGHVAVEKAFDVFDMNTAEGMQSILTAHIGAMDRLLPALESHPLYQDEIGRLRELAATSRTALPLSLPETEARPDENLHPLAIAYVVLGSRLGARILAKRLDAQSTQWTEEVRRYFTDQGSRHAWASLMDELEEHTHADDLALIASDAQQVFALYGEEARALAAAPVAGHA